MSRGTRTDWHTRSGSTAVVMGAICLILAIGSAAAAPVSTQQVRNATTGRMQEAIASQVIVQFAPSAGVRTAAGVHSAMGATPLRSIESIGLDLVACPKGMSVEQTIKAYQGVPGVLSASPNFIARAFGQRTRTMGTARASGTTVSAEGDVSTAATPNDPRWSSLYGMRKISAPDAWNSTTGSSSVVVAIVDSGVELTHPDLAGNMWRNTGEIAGNGRDDDGNGYVDDVYGYDFADGDGDPDVEDDNGDGESHGTHCAGTVGAVGNNGVGVVGVCWDVSIMAVRVLDSDGSGSYYDVAEGIVYAARNGAHVISMSLGGGYDASLQSAINQAYSAGAVICAAMGNEYAHITTDQSTWVSPVCNDGVLGVDNKVIGVAAVDEDDEKAPFSNYSAAYSFCDVSAPGVDIWSCVWTREGSYDSYSGTSMATPHVAGLAALLKAAFPADTNTAIMARIISQAENIDALNPSYAGRLGSGRISAHRSLQPGSAGPARYVEHTIDDDASGGSSGDGDGVPDPGETVEMGVTLRNAGYDTLRNVRATITTSTPGITIIDGTEQFGNIAGGQMATCTEDFDFSVGASVADGTQIQFTIQINADNGGGPWTEQFRVPVGRDQWGEPDDTYQQAPLVLTNGTVYNRRLETGGDQDWFRFNATAHVSYVIETSNLGDLSVRSVAGDLISKGDVGAAYADTILALYGTDGTTLIESNDDGGGGMASRIAWTCPTTGAYYFKVYGYGSASTGTYSVSVTSGAQSVGPIEFSSFTIDDAQNAERGIVGDGDGSAEPGETVEVVVWLTNTGNQTATSVQATFTASIVANALQGSTVPFGDIAAGQTARNTGRLLLTLDQNVPLGVQVILTMSITAGNGGPWEDSFALWVGADPYGEPDNTPAQAKPVETDGTLYSRRISPAGDHDYIKFQAIAGHNYVIQTSNLGDLSGQVPSEPPKVKGGVGALALDTVMHLFGTDGTTELAYDDDGGSGQASRIAWACPANGTYYALVRGHSNTSIGSYQVSVTDTSTGGDGFGEPDDTYQQARLVETDGTLYQRRFEVVGDQDWIKFNAVVSATPYVIETSNLGDLSGVASTPTAKGDVDATMADTVLELYGTDGTTLITSDDDGGVGIASRIEWTPTTPGIYYVKCRGYGNAVTGTYSISVTGPQGQVGPVAYSAHTISDDSIGQSNGDGDGIPEPGETIEVRVGVLNSGVTNARNARGTLATTTGGVTVAVSQASFGDVGPSQVVTAQTSFVLVIGAGVAMGTDIPLALSMNADNGGPWASEFTITVGGAFGEPDDTPAQAQLVETDGRRYDRRLESFGDRDWIKFNATAGIAYVIQTSDLGDLSSSLGGPASAPPSTKNDVHAEFADTVIDLYDTDATTVLRSDDDSGEGLASRITWQCPANGMYYVQVRGYADARTGIYKIGVTAQDFGEPDNTYQQARLVRTDGTLYPRRLEVAGDQDWIKFVVTAGTRAVIETSNLGDLVGNRLPDSGVAIKGDVGAAAVDTVLHLYGTNGTTELAMNDDGGQGLASKIDYTFATAGTYFAKVRGYANTSVGSYSVSVTAQAPTVVGPVEYVTHAVLTETTSGGYGATLGIAVGNVGTGTAEDVTVTITDVTGGGAAWTFSSSAESFGDIAPGASVSSPADTWGTISTTTSLPAGTLVSISVRVEAANGGPWETAFGVTAGRDQWGEPDDAYNQSTLIPTDGTLLNRRLEQAGDQDWFRFVAQANPTTPYVIETTNLDSLAKGADVLPAFANTVLDLYGTEGRTRLATDDDGGAGMASRIVWTCPANGTYYFRVSGYANAVTGTYSVRVSAPQSGGPTYSASGTIADAQRAGIAGVDVAVEAVQQASAVGTAAVFYAVTDANGDFTVAGLPAGDYIVTPAAGGYTFSPRERQITLPPSAADVDFTGAEAPGILVDCDPGAGGWQDTIGVMGGMTFTVDIYAVNVTNLDTWSFELAYDTAALRVGAVTEGPFLASEGGTTLFIPDTFTPGVAKAGNTISGSSAAQSPDGTGVIASIGFTARRDSGSTTLDLRRADFWDHNNVAIVPTRRSGSVTFSLRGDFNADGKVDIADLRLFRAAWGSSDGDGGYEARFDLDGDGEIGYGDFMAFWRANPSPSVSWRVGDLTGDAPTPDGRAGYPEQGPDDYVDVLDLMAFADRLFLDSGDAAWDEVFDFAGANGVPGLGEDPFWVDGRVDFYDLAVLAENWHKGTGPAHVTASGQRALPMGQGSLSIDLQPGIDGVQATGAGIAGDVLEIDVTGADLEAFDAYDLSVTYDPSLLRLVDVRDQGQVIQAAGRRAVSMVDTTTPGRVGLAAAAAGTGAVSATGGTLATIRFELLAGSGEARLGLDGVTLFDADAQAATLSTEGAAVSVLELGEGDWRAEIVVSSGNDIDRGGYFGVIADARARQLLSAPAPAAVGSLSVAFLRDGTVASTAYDEPAAGAHEYRFAVQAAGDARAVTVSWPDLSAIPDRYSVWLVDEAAGPRVSMRTAVNYSYTGSSESVRTFTVRVSDRGASQAMVTSLSASSNGAGSAIVYSLLADAAVTVDIMNIAGRAISRVVADDLQPAGTSTVLWNGRSSSGARVPNGVYLVRITARTEDGQSASAMTQLSYMGR